MMALYSYAYTLPADAPDAPTGDFVSFESTFTTPVLWAPLRVPFGTNLSRSADAYETMDGWQDVVIEQVGEPFGYTRFEDLEDYVDDVHGGFDGEDEEICLRTEWQDGTYLYYNVVAHIPRLGTDYTHIDSDYVRDLKLRYTILNVYTPV